MAAEIQHLVRARPEEMRAALSPLLRLFRDAITAAQEAGVVRGGNPDAHALHILLVLLVYTQARGQGLLSGAEWTEPTREQLWDYCVRSLR